MIKIYIQQIAEKRGIKNANQLKDALAISPTAASRLWKGNFTQIGIVTLDRLCEVLDCKVSDLFEFLPNKTRK